MTFDGKEVISENDLEDINTNSFYAENKKIKEQERDVTKKWRKKDVIISFYSGLSIEEVIALENV